MQVLVLFLLPLLCLVVLNNLLDDIWVSLKDMLELFHRLPIYDVEELTSVRKLNGRLKRAEILYGFFERVIVFETFTKTGPHRTSYKQIYYNY